MVGLLGSSLLVMIWRRLIRLSWVLIRLSGRLRGRRVVRLLSGRRKGWCVCLLGFGFGLDGVG